MTGLLLWKEYLRECYSRHSYVFQVLIRFVFAACTLFSLSSNLGYMAQLNNPALLLGMAVICSLLPTGVTVFVAACVTLAHVAMVSLELMLIILVLMIVLTVLYFSFGTGDSFLVILTALAFLIRVPYAVPLLVGLGGSLGCVVPVSFGVFMYYLLIYVKQNAGVLTGEASVDLVQRYSQIIQSVLLNKTMMVMIAACAAGVVVVYLIRRLSVDYAWTAASLVGCVVQLLTIFVGDLLFGASVETLPMVLGLVLSAAIAMIYTFFMFSVDYTRTEYVQFEDDDYYYFVKAVPKMTVSTTDVQVKKISTRRKSGRERERGKAD